jgi:excinuclease ABC subunit A
VNSQTNTATSGKSINTVNESSKVHYVALPQENAQVPQSPAVIRVRGARVHNLQNVNIDIPRDALTVITGVSGSGKSSLAFDTIYAEGQRQYIESLSTYARQFLDQLQRPDVDIVEGLEPTLCIDQKPGSHNPRSTVATITEIYDYLRLLFSRAGTPHCYHCGRAILRQSTEQIVASLGTMEEGTKLMILSPRVRGRKGVHNEVFAEIRKAGLVRVRVDGELYPLDEIPALAPRKSHTIEAVVDRIVVREGCDQRVADSVRLALQMSDGLVTLVHQAPGKSDWTDRLISTHYACPDCEISYEELEPRTFSFNSPYGACPNCDGMGRVETIPPSKPSPSKPSPSKPSLSKPSPSDDDESPDTQISISELCPTCHGGRLRAEALAVTVADLNIQQTCALSIEEAVQHFENLGLAGTEAEVAKPIMSEVIKRTRFLLKVGVGYLTLDRSADTLSGGEMQRVKLATSIGSGLVGVC